jgi:hypothetical protein
MMKEDILPARNLKSVAPVAGPASLPNMDTSFARSWLRLEGLAMLLTAAAAYQYCGLRWLVFGVLFLTPDLSMLCYLGGRRLGALAYNVVHSYTGPLALIAIGLTLGPLLVSGYGLIWCAHIGFDRLLGYGLKSPEGFRFTHLGKIGRDKTAG